MKHLSIQDVSSLQLAVLLLAVFFLSFAGRLAWISHSQYELATQHLQQGENKRALMALERSIHAYLPYLSSRERAMDKMVTLLGQLEISGDQQLALEGWRRLRGSILSTRSVFGQPDQDTLLKANHNIARLTALTDVQDKRSKKEIEHEVAELLEAFPKDISAFWGVMQFMLLLLWIGSTLQLIWNWLGYDIRKRVLMSGVSCGSFLGWLGSLYLAG